MWVELRKVIVQTQKEDEDIFAAIQEVLDEQEEVFEMSDSLPPFIERNHAMVLKKGTLPVTVRPYRTLNIKRTK